MVYMIILYFLATETYLFEDNYARCQDKTGTTGSLRVYVGFFNEDGLVLYGDFNTANPHVGTGTSRKIPS
jgi:hypothetical protein